MPDEKKGADIVHGVPPIAVSSGSTLANRTGSWKYIQPQYQDRGAPCNAACPAGIDIEGAFDLLRQDKVAEAAELVRRENPMPAVTGRVCDHPCALSCNRAQYDGALNIRAVERMLGDRDGGLPPASPKRPRGEKVAVVGSGPAGLSCAYHLARMGYAVTVFEADAEPGGWLRWALPEYRLPRAVLAREVERIRSAGVTFRCNARVGGDTSWKEIEKFDATFLATGARVSQPLGLSAGAAHDVRSGIEFLRELRSGTAGPLGRRVVVAGGTDAGVDCARSALRLGAEATLVCQGAREDLKANPEAVAEAEREGVKFEFLTRLTALKASEHANDEKALDAIHTMYVEGDGHAPARLTALECVRLQRAAGGQAPSANTPIAGSAFTMPADTLLVALGEEPDFAFLPADINRKGYLVKVDDFGHTSRAGFFAGGDIAGEKRTVAHSLGSGKRAAIGIDRYLREKAGETVPALDAQALRYGGTGSMSVTRWRGDDPVLRTREVNELVPFDDLNMAHFIKVPGTPDRLRAVEECRTGFAESNLGLSEAEALAEAKRCFNCGVCNQCGLCMIFCPDVAIKPHSSGHGYSLSYKYCKGCGVCVEECPRGAMIMTREGL